MNRRRPLRSAIVAAALAAALAGAAAGCETVDLGAPPADVNACRPGQQWFVDQIWPNVLAADYAGKHCYDAACHAPATGHSPVLVVPVEPGAIPLPTDWAANYTSASEEMNCSIVDSSDLLTKPEGLAGHGGGMLFAPDSMQATLLEMWVTQP